MDKLILITVLLVSAAIARTYPEYKQCHNSWKDDKMGSTDKTICTSGALMTCAAMALSGIGMDYNPATLNKWLMTHGGYIHGSQFVWASMNSLTMEYEGRINNFMIEKKMNEGYVVICNVNNGTHWVLAHSHLGDKIHANDPLYNKTAYLLTEIVDGQTAIFRLTNPDPNTPNSHDMKHFAEKIYEPHSFLNRKSSNEENYHIQDSSEKNIRKDRFFNKILNRRQSFEKIQAQMNSMNRILRQH